MRHLTPQGKKEPLKGRFDIIEFKWTADLSLTLPAWHLSRVEMMYLVQVFLPSYPLGLSPGLCSTTYRAQGLYFSLW